MCPFYHDMDSRYQQNLLFSKHWDHASLTPDGYPLALQVIHMAQEYGIGTVAPHIIVYRLSSRLQVHYETSKTRFPVISNCLEVAPADNFSIGNKRTKTTKPP